ncbi:11384_t:CDS:2 [Acaulospora colombiana]|uniref:11384_t:CDS:1 n=1 Tax=Acaulospora colombiana TaxID=27376 RepID=A0ACA9KAD0_9GLOM|nr:11384_t:CDS:2 [Acaulospora colombiana]
MRTDRSFLEGREISLFLSPQQANPHTIFDQRKSARSESIHKNFPAANQICFGGEGGMKRLNHRRTLFFLGTLPPIPEGVLPAHLHESARASNVLGKIDPGGSPNRFNFADRDTKRRSIMRENEVDHPESIRYSPVCPPDIAHCSEQTYDTS